MVVLQRRINRKSEHAIFRSENNCCIFLSANANEVERYLTETSFWGEREESKGVPWHLATPPHPSPLWLMFEVLRKGNLRKEWSWYNHSWQNAVTTIHATREARQAKAYFLENSHRWLFEFGSNSAVQANHSLFQQLHIVKSNNFRDSLKADIQKDAEKHSSSLRLFLQCCEMHWKC